MTSIDGTASYPHQATPTQNGPLRMKCSTVFILNKIRGFSQLISARFLEVMWARWATYVSYFFVNYCLPLQHIPKMETWQRYFKTSVENAKLGVYDINLYLSILNVNLPVYQFIDMLDMIGISLVLSSCVSKEC